MLPCAYNEQIIVDCGFRPNIIIFTRTPNVNGYLYGSYYVKYVSRNYMLTFNTNLSDGSGSYIAGTNQAVGLNAGYGIKEITDVGFKSGTQSLQTPYVYYSYLCGLYDEVN